MSSIKVSLYCDEIRESPILMPDGTKEVWVYLGLLIVPEGTKEKLLLQLLSSRCGNPKPCEWGKCVPECKYHDKNDKEVHYSELRSADIANIARRWMRFFLSDKELTYFYILGLNLTRMNYSYFGDATGTERYNIIYNRFFRTAVQKSIKSYFAAHDTIEVVNIYHDAGELEDHDRFPWHTIYRLDYSDPKLRFNCSRIRFIDSDHRISGLKEAHFIQYIDLLMGLVYSCFHASSKKDEVRDLTYLMLPLVERLMRSQGNINSSFKYVGRLSVDFFPKNRITNEQSFENDMKRLDSFYKIRPVAVRDHKQPGLFDDT